MTGTGLKRAIARPALLAHLLVIALILTSCDGKTEPESAASGQWREFEGSWTAAGSRRSIPLGPGRSGSIFDLRGSMLLTGAGRPDVGFGAQVIALVDSETGLVGRAVWTDERGDQVFSELKGEGTRSGNHIVGTFLGGTGRFAEAAGDYQFSWQYVIESDDGSIQGRAVGLKGRVRIGKPVDTQPGTGGARQ